MDEMLKNKHFGLPSIKKYPMPDAEHVKSAIKFFNYIDKAHETELADAILSRINELDLDIDTINVGDKNRFKKYLEKSRLKHYGILGMKWGVRRYQNADGSLTAAGLRRYSDNSIEKKSKLKTGIKIAAGVAITAVAAYGAYRLGKDFVNAKNAIKIVESVDTNKSVQVAKLIDSSSKPKIKIPSSSVKSKISTASQAATKSIFGDKKVPLKSAAKKSVDSWLKKRSINRSMKSINNTTSSIINYTNQLIQNNNL